jgi:hypothetical protein
MKFLTTEERQLFAEFTARDASEKAAAEEAKEQLRRRNEIDAQRQKPNQWAENVAGDQAEYVAGRRGVRRTIQLSPTDAAPKQLPLETVDSRLAAINARLAEIEIAAKPASQPVEPEMKLALVWRAVLRKIWNWATK